MEDPGPVVVDDDVSAFDEPEERASAVAGGEVEDEPALAFVEAGEAEHEASEPVAGDGLHLDDVGAELGEERGAVGAGDDGAEVEDAGEGAGGTRGGPVGNGPGVPLVVRGGMLARAGRRPLHPSRRAGEVEGDTRLDDGSPVGVVDLDAHADGGELGVVDPSVSPGEWPYRTSGRGEDLQPVGSALGPERRGHPFDDPLAVRGEEHVRRVSLEAWVGEDVENAERLEGGEHESGGWDLSRPPRSRRVRHVHEVGWTGVDIRPARPLRIPPAPTADHPAQRARNVARMSAVWRGRFQAGLMVLVGVPVLVLHVLGPASAHSAPAAHGETAFEWSCGPLPLDGAVATPPPSPAPISSLPSTIVGPLGIVADPPALSLLCRWRI